MVTVPANLISVTEFSRFRSSNCKLALAFLMLMSSRLPNFHSIYTTQNPLPSLTSALPFIQLERHSRFVMLTMFRDDHA